MTAESVTSAARAVQTAEAALTAARETLRGELRQAYKSGATIAELQEWTGYSRRTVFYLLKDSKPV
jgi:hypothetical protein